MESSALFSSKGRKSQEEVREQSLSVLNMGFYKQLLDALPYLGAILNEERQVVYANRELLDYLGVESIEEVLGGRPGEILGCKFAINGTGGCGTTENCVVCGAAQSIDRAQRTGLKVTEECRIASDLRGMPVHYDLRVTVTPVMIGNNQYLVVALSDISDAKRRKVLERIFFHDILNLSGSLQSLVEIIRNEIPGGDIKPFLETFAQISSKLTEEIISQRELLAAENNDLVAHLSTFGLQGFLDRELAATNSYASETSRNLSLVPSPKEITLTTDATLLSRVLINMIKNAIEASGPGDTVSIGTSLIDGKAIIWVKNPGVMTRKVQLQIFQRSFSTKGSGRGIGTYSMKLLTEKYLRGMVYFESKEPEGTTFFLELPLE